MKKYYDTLASTGIFNTECSEADLSQKWIQRVSHQFYPYRMRCALGFSLVFCLAQHFKFKDILEIGWFRGQTFCTLLEALGPGTRFTAVDKIFYKDVYDNYYHNTSHTIGKDIEFITKDSKNFMPHKEYDFINIDGGHDYETAFKDLSTAAACLTKNGVLMVDDYKNNKEFNYSVGTAIEEFLKLNTGLIPFLCDNQAMYFHYPEHDATEFLDIVLKQEFQHVANLNNLDFNGYTVKSVLHKPIDLSYVDQSFLSFHKEKTQFVEWHRTNRKNEQ